MAKMFDEKENDFIERINSGYGWCRVSLFEQDDKHIWTLRLKNFVCQKNETVKEMKSRFDYLVDKLKTFEIKLTDALPAEWDDVLKKIKQESEFSKLHPSDFIDKLTSHSYENSDKKKELINKIKRNLDELDLGNLEKMNLDVIAEIDRRICICFAAQRIMRYDNKRGCYIDNNLNPLDFVKKICAVTRTETEQVSKNEESVKLGSSNSESVCSKFDKFEADNVKLLNDAESLTLEIKNLKNEKQSEINRLLKCEKFVRN
ncbi:hypothetical protein Hanom_Chr15g01379141 [Helianthus anomalus]